MLVTQMNTVVTQELVHTSQNTKIKMKDVSENQGLHGHNKMELHRLIECWDLYQVLV